MSGKKPWFEIDRFWEATQPFLFSENIMQKTSGEVDRMLDLLKLEPGTALLDLCCGTGRHSNEFARRGFIVTGVDRKDSYLKQAEEDAAKEELTVEFVLEDMRRFIRPDTFDGVINIFTSFGYFDNPSDEQLVLDNIYRSLKPGGRLLMEMVGKEIIAKTYKPREWGEKDGLLLLHEQKPIENWTYMENRRLLIDGDKIEEFRFTIRLYSAHELTTILKQAGFTQVDIYGSLDGIAYDNNAKRLVAMAQK